MTHSDPQPDPQFDIRPDPPPARPAAAGPSAGHSGEHSGGSCRAGLFGKLPARGDFVTRNIPPELLRPFEDWLMAVMRDARALLDQAWTPTWLQAPAWRFWIGGAALDGDWRHGFQGRAAAARAAAVTGVLLPSADRLGRHFPLVILLADRNAHLMPPPVLGHADRGWYAACERLLHAAREGAGMDEVEARLASLPAPGLPPEGETVAGLLERRSLWAVGDPADGPEPAAASWADIRAVDHHLAAFHRSYWWREPLPGVVEPFAALTLPGLPDPDSFAFMLSGALPEPRPPQPETRPEALSGGVPAVPDGAGAELAPDPATGPESEPDPAAAQRAAQRAAQGIEPEAHPQAQPEAQPEAPAGTVDEAAAGAVDGTPEETAEDTADGASGTAPDRPAPPHTTPSHTVHDLPKETSG